LVKLGFEPDAKKECAESNLGKPQKGILSPGLPVDGESQEAQQRRAERDTGDDLPDDRG